MMAGPIPDSPPAPRPPLAHGAWLVARRAVLTALAEGETLVVLAGAPGLGKSRLLRDLEHALRAPGRPVTRLDDGAFLDPEALPPLLLVDEAGRLDDAALLALARRGAGLAVLAALPGFAARLEGLPHRVVALQPLRPRDVPAYLDARLRETGQDPARLDAAAVAALAEAAGGVPARLNLLAGSAVLAADIAGAPRVLPAHVAEAVAMHDGLTDELPAPAPPATPAVPGPLVPAAAAPPAPRYGALVPLPPAAPPRRPLWPLAGGALLLAAGLAWLLWPAGPAEAPPMAATPAQPTPPAQPPAAAPAIAPLPGTLAEAAPTPPPGAPDDAVATTDTPSAPPAAPVDEAVPATPPPGTTPQAIAPPTLPAGAVPRVVVTYPRGETPTAAAALASALAEAGLAAAAPFPVPRATATPELRYFFREDRPAALAVQALALPALGAATARLHPLDGGGLPRPGAIEAVLPATPGPSPEPEPSPPEPGSTEATPPPAATLLAPAEAAALPAGTLALSWRAPPGTAAFVEVLALDGDAAPREILATFAEAPDRHPLRAGPGRYAWRVLAVSAAQQRYAASPWRSFTLTEAPP